MPLVTYIHDDNVVLTDRTEVIPRVGEVVAIPVGSVRGDEVLFDLYTVTQIVHFPHFESVKLYLKWEDRKKRTRR